MNAKEIKRLLAKQKREALEKKFEQQLCAEKFPPWEREHPFHPTRKWRFDFAWPKWKVAVEVEGGTWTSGRHVRGSGFQKDCEKYNNAALLGWTVMRGDSSMVKDLTLLEYTKRALVTAVKSKRKEKTLENKDPKDLNLSQMIVEVKAGVEELEAETDKVFISGNKAAARRARKTAMQIKNYMHEVRKRISDIISM